MSKMASNREAVAETIRLSVERTLDELQGIWHELGLDGGQTSDRIKLVGMHINNLLGQMVDEELRMRDKNLQNLAKYRKELAEITKELTLPDYEPSTSLMGLRLEKDLSQKCEALRKERGQRLEQLDRLRRDDQQLCDMLATTPYYIPSGTVPSQEQLSELEQHIGDMTKEKEKRLQILRRHKSSINKLLEDLEEHAETSFEKDVLLEPEDNFVLSMTNLKAVKELHDRLERKSNDNYALASELRTRMNTLWERLDTPAEERAEFSATFSGYKPSVISSLRSEILRLESLKFENMQRVIDGAREDLHTWWDKCFISPAERKAFTPANSEECSEDVLDALDREVTRLRSYYNTNKAMLDNVISWQDLFQKYLDFELKCSDPNRLFNRGGNLLKEQKERKKFKNQLPKLEQDVTDQIAEWEGVHGREFLVNGVQFVEYIRQQWDDYNRNKENEKEQRNIAKAREMEHELMYGSKPATTPGKRRMLPCGTPTSKTPSKLRKLNDTPGSVSRMGRTTYNGNTMCSPVCMPPRSASRPTPTGKIPSRPGTVTPLPPTSQSTPQRRVLAPTGNNCAAASEMGPPKSATIMASSEDDTLMFSHTTVASETVIKSDTVAAVPAYQDFAREMNFHKRENHRSSILPSVKPSC